ncbi:hypothetical protein BN3662_01506 [Clostridiales bacterium CHKCI006]|nr:hypothetical protein BN3662_01506 [Clostridiales bacterium CHKCI006]
MNKTILDVCCGSRMFYYAANDERLLCNDIRYLDDILCDGRKLTIHPDTEYDFRDLPFEDDKFYHVVFDPPHLLNVGDNSWLAQKYGKLPNGWRTYIKQGFGECMRVLKRNGTLVMKWNTRDISLPELLSVVGKPLYGDKGHGNGTYWLIYVK